MLRKNNKGEYTPYSTNISTKLEYPYIQTSRMSDISSTVIKDLPKGVIPLVYVEKEESFILTNLSYDLIHYNWMIKWCEFSVHFSETEIVKITDTKSLLNALTRIKELRGGE